LRAAAGCSSLGVYAVAATAVADASAVDLLQFIASCMRLSTV
jgi:malonyl CoA-acyl carrier protein transacylase